MLQASLHQWRPAARAAGNKAVNKAASSAAVSKIADNETVSKIVDNETVKKISKNKNKRVVLLGAMAILAVIIIIAILPGGGGGGGNLDGTWVYQGRMSGIPGPVTASFRFEGNRYTYDSWTYLVEQGTYTISGNRITFNPTSTNDPMASSVRTQTFSRSGNTITIGSTQYTKR